LTGSGGAQGALQEWAGEGENVKKLIGMILLASFPVACGSLPSGPDAVTTNPADDATVSSLARRQPAPTPLPCGFTVPIPKIRVTVIEYGKGSVTLQADADLPYDSPHACFTPVWSFGAARGAVLTVTRDPQVAILAGPAGRYLVTAEYGEVVGSAWVRIN
jgi:hypothetical protein